MITGNQLSPWIVVAFVFGVCVGLKIANVTIRRRIQKCRNPEMPDIITPTQFVILSFLIRGEAAGKDVRAKLAQEGQRKSVPAFYQLMARLEDSGFVVGRYDQKVVEGQLLKERRYTITGHGQAVFRDACD